MAYSDLEKPVEYSNEKATYAPRGTKILKAGTRTGRFAAFIPREAAEITAIEINGAAGTLANYGLDGTTLIAGIDQIWFSEDEVVTSVTFTGSLIAINR